MRNAARPILAVVLTLLLSGAALYTGRRLADVDPRGRASWTAVAPTFDATPRDLTLFVPACGASAVVLHPAAASRATRVHAEFFITTHDGAAGRAGTVSVSSTPGRPLRLPIGGVQVPARAPLIVRISTPDGELVLDQRRPVTLEPPVATVAGTLTCAFDGGNTAQTATTATATLVLMIVSGLCAAAWLARAVTGAVDAVRPTHTLVAALLMAGATTIVYSLVVPPFEPPDELAHLQYARYVATTGTLPSAVPAPDSEWRAASYEFVQQPLYYIGAAAVLRSIGLATPGPVLALNPRSRMHAGGTEPTIFEHGATPAPATGHEALRVLRFASLLMVLGTTWLIARLLATVTADPLIVATVAGGLGLIPQWCAVMGAVSTDPPATLLAAAATLAVVRLAHGRQGATWLMLTGVLIGAAYAVKATTAFLVPMAVLACVLSAYSEQPRPGSERRTQDLARVALHAALLLGAGVILAAGWVPARAWIVFGDPRARMFKRAVLEAGGFMPTRGPMPWTSEFWTQMRVMVFEPFWARFGSLGAGPFPDSRVWVPYAAASLWIVLLAHWGAIGESVSTWSRTRQVSRTAPGDPLGERARSTVYALSVCGVGVCLGLAAWIGVNLVPQADMVVHWTPRHILPLTAPAALLVGAGLERLRHASALTRRAGAALTGATLAALALAWLGVLRATVLTFHFGY